VSSDAQVLVPSPLGFTTHVANAGIKDTSDDFVVIASDVPAVAVGMFTKSRFAGPSVTLSQAHLADRSARAIGVISKNANVATGHEGIADAAELAEGIGKHLGAPTEEVVIASTGVIGVRYPEGAVHRAVTGIDLTPADFTAAARGIMTTDTTAKVVSRTVGGATLVGIAKGVGMIEPDMATLLTFVCTDAELDPDTADTIFRSVVERTFNCLSVDTDTSTSDTAVLLANGLAGPVGPEEFEQALFEVMRELTRACAIDGEGAETLIEVNVTGAADFTQARRVAKLVVNSPLVKTAVHGRDPNWGRVAMAVGKASEDERISPDHTRISFAGFEVYPDRLDAEALALVGKAMDAAEVDISVDLGVGAARATVWGCDLTDGYVRINADYTT